MPSRRGSLKKQCIWQRRSSRSRRRRFQWRSRRAGQGQTVLWAIRGRGRLQLRKLWLRQSSRIQEKKLIKAGKNSKKILNNSIQQLWRCTNIRNISNQIILNLTIAKHKHSAPSLTLNPLNNKFNFLLVLPHSVRFAYA
jgi:hypothetical protein